MGANALWDVATETGEIACAVLVPSTKTRHFSHAARQLANRSTFLPSVMYSDTWPAKTDYWEGLFSNRAVHLTGRLGLFHYIQRITKTLKKKHCDHYLAVNGLLKAIYRYNDNDYEKLLSALKNGTLSTKYSEDEITDLKSTKIFRQRYAKYLRKEIRPPMVLRQMLDDWFDTYKCSTSNPKRPARGRLDPLTGITLFTAETREAILNCKDKASYVQDPLPLEQMYKIIPPGPNSTHGLNEYLSRRGESSLESFHLMLAHFGNCGMRTSLADNLNLLGTARYNLGVRQKLRLTDENTQRSKIPAAFEAVVPFFNHTELRHINQLAIDAGVSNGCVPFTNVEPLPPDNGERFFSEYLSWMRKAKPTYDENDQCRCEYCRKYQSISARKKAPATQTETDNTQETLTDTHIAGTVDTNTTDLNNATGTYKNTATNLASATTEHRANQQLPQCQDSVRVQPMQHQQHAQQHIIVPTQPTFWHPSFAPPLPWMCPPPMLFPTTMQMPSFCCSRCREWHNTDNRRGRPPHDLSLIHI